jgi:hypothetical protein
MSTDKSKELAWTDYWATEPQLTTTGRVIFGNATPIVSEKIREPKS